MYERVFVIEITGLRLGFLRERLEHLPHLSRIAENGAVGRLTGPRQPVLPTSYAVLYTGKNPGKTGFFDFFRFSKGGYDRIPYSLDQLEEETLFQRISIRPFGRSRCDVIAKYELVSSAPVPATNSS